VQAWQLRQRLLLLLLVMAALWVGRHSMHGRRRWRRRWLLRMLCGDVRPQRPWILQLVVRKTRAAVWGLRLLLLLLVVVVAEERGSAAVRGLWLLLLVGAAELGARVDVLRLWLLLVGQKLL
jgi:hypothetical protein